jgi:hypothetical protein
MSAEQKQRVIIDTIRPDAPHGNINFVTLSFLTPQNVTKTKHVDIRGFKIYGGYINEDLAKAAGAKIKQENPSHNVFVAQMGELYDWDNVNNTDEMDYGDSKQNAIEKNRRADADKTRLIKQQLANDLQAQAQAKIQTDRRKQINAKLANKLHAKGLLTRNEKEREDNRSTERDAKAAQTLHEKEECIRNMDEQMEECFKTDYLDVHPHAGHQFGCISFYSPKRIGGLKQLCFKVRCLSETPERLQKRIQAFKKSTPNEPLAIFEVGKWHPYHETQDNLTEQALKQLNYCMCHYIESIKIEAQEFEARKKAEIEKAAEKNAETKNKNEELASEDTNPDENTTATSASASASKFLATLDAKDQAAIADLMAYLDDPELRDRTKVSGPLEQMVIDV